MTRITIRGTARIPARNACLIVFLAFCIAVVSLPCIASGADTHAGNDARTVLHSLVVELFPQRAHLQVEDTITLPDERPGDSVRNVRFALHEGLDVRVLTPGVRLTIGAPGAIHGAAPATMHTLEVPAGVRSVRLFYEGTLDHPIVFEPGDRARGVSGTPGAISEDGVFLAPASRWYPEIAGVPLARFDMTVRLPRYWDAVSQGERTMHEREARGTRVRWEEDHPQPGLYLIAGRYTEYTRRVDVDEESITAMAFLRSPDRTLAARYLEAADRYLRFYSDLLGPYPYEKFALVENFWETGYGMPSFTLLGPTVIRLPFIADTSFPHEILHNWWGNGVYVDYARGNWAEGLTAYLADHLLAERRGRTAGTRRDQLQRYADYVRAGEDFPLREFRARHSPASEAVGYGKGMMLFHMLRLRLGDAAFFAGLRDFRREHLFGMADFDDLRRAFARHADDDLEAEFHQWTERTGAPALRIDAATARALADGRFEVIAAIEQTQPGPAYTLRVPVEVTLESGDVVDEVILIEKAREEVRIVVDGPPRRLAVDPYFDVFRHVDRREIPPALSQAFGARRILAVIPAGAPPPLRDAYAALAGRLHEPGVAEVRTITDDTLAVLPTDGAVWLLGWENRGLATVKAALPAQADFDDGALRIGGEPVDADSEGAVLVTRAPGNAELALVWIGAATPDALATIARKLPHYGRYGWLRFDAGTAEVTARGQWEVTETPLVVEFDPPQ